jgi:CDP-diglyceride synthetase
VPEPGDEQLSPNPQSARGDRTEAVATLVALVWASTVAIVFAVYGGNVSLVGLLAISPFIAAVFARPSRVALVGILAAFFALVISAPPRSYGELNHTLRVVTMLAATAVAMWISICEVSATSNSGLPVPRPGTKGAGALPPRRRNGCRPWRAR